MQTIQSRIWDQTKPLIGFIGLNPSTADHIEDDKTILLINQASQNTPYILKEMHN